MTCAQAQPASKEELFDAFQQAVDEQNQDALVSLYYFEGVNDEMRLRAIDQIGKYFLSDEFKIISLSFAQLPKDAQTEIVQNGMRYRPSVEPLGYIEVQFSEKSPFQTMSLPYGEVNGSFYLASTVVEEMKDRQQSSKQFNIIVMHLTELEPPSFEGMCTYWHNNQKMQKGFKGKGDYNESFFGDKIEYCKVKKTSDEGKFQLQIYEHGRLIFESKLIGSKEQFTFAIK